jgi:tetratricopeptide (TPR) repeat protein
MTTAAAPALHPVPGELVEAGASGHLVVLVGAGASHGSGLPLWSELLAGLFSRAQAAGTPEQHADLVEVKEWFFGQEGGPQEKASQLGQVMGDAWLAGAIAAELRVATAAPTATHRALAAIPGAAFLTTNYDTLLETALAEGTGVRPKVVLLSDVEGIRDFGAGQVLKLHGDIDAPETIVLSSKDYFRVSHLVKRAWKHRLQALLQGAHKLLLVGYGYGDVDVQQVVDELRGAYGDKLPGPFWLEKEGVRTRSKAKASGLRPIWLPDYSNVVPWLEELSRAIKARKAQAPTVIKAVAYAEKVRERFKLDQELAGELFRKEEYEEAERAYRKLLGEAEGLLPADPESGELKRVIASCRANIGGCLICQQRGEDALVAFRQAAEEVEHLSGVGRALLAEGLAQLGDRERARTVLGDVEPSSEEARVRLEDTRRLLEVLEGRLPEVDRPTSSPILGLYTARLLLEQGRLDEAARKALETLQAAPENAIVRLYSLVTIANALGRSVLEEPEAKAWIPAAQRERMVTAIEEGLRWLDARLAAPRLRRDLERLRLFFAELTEDEKRITAKRESSQTLASGAMESLPAAAITFQRAQHLAEEGRLDEAFQLLPRSEHPWVGAWNRTHLKFLARRFDEALGDALDLARRFPGRAPIEATTAKLLARASRPDEAVPHARAAFEALPGRGYRLLLGQCLLSAGRHADAADVLEPLADSNDRQVLRAHAMAIEPSDPMRALAIWRHYVDVFPDELAVRFHIAQLLFKTGQAQNAAAEAWRLFESAKDRLDPQMLYECAQFQQLDGAFGEDARKRVETIAKALEERSQGNQEAEHYRLLLLMTLGFPSQARPVDFGGLVASGFLRTGTLDELSEILGQQFIHNEEVRRAYRLGHLPFESLCELTGTMAATYVTLATRIAEKRGPVLLCAPVAFGAMPPSLAGQRLLVGELELLLLQHLGLLGKLRDALGPGGKLVLFRDVWERMVTSAAELETRTQRIELEEQERLFDRLHGTLWKIKIEEDADVTSDAEWARERGLAIVDNEATKGGTRLSPRALVAYLQQQGHLDTTQVDRILHALVHEDEPLPALPDPLPARLAIAYTPLQIFFDAGAIDALLATVPDRLVIGPRAMRVLNNRRQELRQTVEAAELASAVQRATGAGIAEGWIDVSLVRPSIPDLPDACDPADSESARRFATAFSFRQALAEDPRLWLLTADYFVTSAMGDHVDIARRLAWPGAAVFEAVSARMHAVTVREVHMPDLLGHLVVDPDHRKIRIRLAELGFVNALRQSDPNDLLDLADRYGGLDKAEPERILQRLEWVAREPAHPGGTEARVRLAALYAMTIWEAFKDNDRGTRAKALTGTLLKRAESIDTTVLDLTVQFTVAELVSKPRFAFGDTPDEQNRWTLLPGSPPGRLCKHLWEWSGTVGSRRAAYGRALRESWLLMDQLCGAEGPTIVQAAPLLLPIQVAPTNLGEPEMEAAAILSALWRKPPFEKLPMRVDAGNGSNVEAILQSLADLLHSEPSQISADESYLRHAGTGEAGPPEAVLLRAAPQAVAQFAPFLARHQGPHDGRAYALLAQLAQEPKNEDVRRAYARTTVVAPWRLIREDPAMLKTWASRALLGAMSFPAGLDDLRVMLSEPSAPFPPEGSVYDVLRTRVAEGGMWAERHDKEALARQACEVPGLLSSVVLPLRLAQEKGDYDEEVAEALRHLNHPEDHPSARLAGDVFFLRVAAARRPYIGLPGGEIDLRERLPERFLFLLRSILDEAPRDASAENDDRSFKNKKNAPADTLASAEADLLRVCGQVVLDLAHGQLVPLKDGLWLTYRLFQWLCAQLEAISPDARSAGIRALRKDAPPPEKLAPGADDLLNPFGFKRDRFDHRLATVLYAFGFMEDLLLQIPGTAHDVKESPRAVTSTGLEDLLAEVAARPLSEDERLFRAKGDKPSHLDWIGPGALPDLALRALLHLNRGAFFQMPIDRRLAWILDLPRNPDQLDRAGWPLASLIVDALIRHAEQLSPEEKIAFEERLRAMDGGPETKAPSWRWLGFTELFAAGQRHLEVEAFQMLLENLAKEQVAPAALGSYLAAVAAQDPARLEGELDRVLARVEQDGLDPVPFASALARVIIVGGSHAIQEAQRVLRKLGARPPFQGDARMRQLLGTLGMR